MAHTPKHTEAAAPDFAQVETGVCEELVREELQRVLASREFQSSKLCQSFLRYVVESRLKGHDDTLKERTIGIDVFGKPASYDPSEDAGVRVKAGEVRKRLRSFYSSQPTQSSVVIELPPGTYVPEFRVPESKAPTRPAGKWSFGWRGFAAAIIVTTIITAAVVWLHPRPQVTALDRFWAPLLQGHSPVFVCTAPVPVYSDMRNLSGSPPARREDFVLVPNRFVAVSDINSVLQIADMFNRMGKRYRLSIGNDASFRDMRLAPSVLVGFSYTQWHEIGEHFRYSIDLSRRPFGVLKDNEPTNWTIRTHPDDPDLNEDYAIVSRVLYPGTNNFIVEITGISQYGTEAAADLVSNPSLFGEALNKLPAGWEQKNVQIVLHVEVVSGYPSVPTVVATHVW